ncbi:MAG: hypothetical protein AAFU64_11325, partial [Bacteroidota bacterium]
MKLQNNLHRPWGMGLLLILFLVILDISPGQAQFGKLKNIKNKVDKKLKGKKSESSQEKGKSKETSAGLGLGQSTKKADQDYVKLLEAKADLAAQIVSAVDDPWSNYFRLEETYEEVKQLDYPKLAPILKEKGRPELKVPGYNYGGEYYDVLAKYPDDMEKIWQEALQKRILELFDQAYAQKKHSVKLALDALKESQTLCELMTLSFPQHAAARQQLADIKAAYQDIGGQQ